jgi:hypothetical protein
LLIRIGRQRRIRKHGGHGALAYADPPRRVTYGDIDHAIPESAPDSVDPKVIYPDGVWIDLPSHVERAALWTVALGQVAASRQRGSRVLGATRSAVGLVTDGNDLRLALIFYVRRLALLQAAPLTVKVDGECFPVVLRPPPVRRPKLLPTLIQAGAAGMITCWAAVAGGRGFLTAAHVAAGLEKRYRLQQGDYVDCQVPGDGPPERKKVLAACGVMDAAIIEDDSAPTGPTVPINPIAGNFGVMLSTPQGATVYSTVVEVSPPQGVVRGQLGKTPNAPAELLITEPGEPGWSGALVTETYTGRPYGMFVGDTTLQSGRYGRVHMLLQHEIVWGMQVLRD